MEIVFLGTGTSQGVPMIAHDSPGLDLEDKRNWRTRTCAHVVMAGHHIQIDAAPEFRLQCIENRIEKVDTFILTHGHADHIAGMDDLRRFIDLRDGLALPVYSTANGLGRVEAMFPYAIGARPVTRGYPAFTLHEMPEVLELPGGTIKRCYLPHGKLDVLGLVFEEKTSGKRLAYFTDCKRVPDEARALAYEADVIVLDALRPMEHPTHMTIDEALSTAAELKGKTTYFIHMTYMIDHERYSAMLPPGVELAYDGLRVVL